MTRSSHELDYCIRISAATLKDSQNYDIGSDNGPKIIAAPLLTRIGIKPIQICPGSRWENGYNERFNGTLRAEMLNAE